MAINFSESYQNISKNQAKFPNNQNDLIPVNITKGEKNNNENQNYGPEFQRQESGACEILIQFWIGFKWDLLARLGDVFTPCHFHWWFVWLWDAMVIVYVNRASIRYLVIYSASNAFGSLDWSASEIGNWEKFNFGRIWLISKDSFSGWNSYANWPVNLFVVWFASFTCFRRARESIAARHRWIDIECSTIARPGVARLFVSAILNGVLPVDWAVRASAYHYLLPSRPGWPCVWIGCRQVATPSPLIPGPAFMALLTIKRECQRSLFLISFH